MGNTLFYFIIISHKSFILISLNYLKIIIEIFLTLIWNFFPCEILSNNISNYGLDSLILFIFILKCKISKKDNNDFYLFLTNYIMVLRHDCITIDYSEKLELHNKLNLFNTVNSGIIKDLYIIIILYTNMLLIIFLYSFQTIQSVGNVLLILFLIIVVFNFNYYPFLFKKRKISIRVILLKIYFI